MRSALAIVAVGCQGLLGCAVPISPDSGCWWLAPVRTSPGTRCLPPAWPDAGWDASSADANELDAGTDAGVDAGIEACYPQAVQWTGGDAACGRAAILYVEPPFEPAGFHFRPIYVNDRGTVLLDGWESIDSRIHARAAFWRDGGVERLLELDQFQLMRPLELGPNDEVVGRLEGYGGQGFIRWGDGGVHVFENFQPDGAVMPTQAVDVNARGEVLLVVGGQTEVWSAEGTVRIPRPFPEAAVKGQYLNDQGVVAGHWYRYNPSLRPDWEKVFIWSRDGGFVNVGAGCIVDPSALSGGSSGTSGLTNSGTLLMGCGCPGLANPLLRYPDGGMRALGGIFLGRIETSDINDKEWIVGNEPPVGRRTAMLLRNGGRCSLESMLPPDAGWLIDVAWSINDNGLIVAHARPGPDDVYGVGIVLRIDLPDGG